MRDPNRGGGRVDTLTAGPGRTVDVDLEVVVVELDVDILGLGHHGDSRRRGVDPALRLGHRNPLDAMGPALPLEDRVRAVALDRDADALEEAGRVRAQLQRSELAACA